MGWGCDIRTKVKSLKIDIAERTRNCESLLLKITDLNIFVENYKKIKEILLEKKIVLCHFVKADYDIIISYDII